MLPVQRRFCGSEDGFRSLLSEYTLKQSDGAPLLSYLHPDMVHSIYLVQHAPHRSIVQLP